jgi:hypothetical protein
MNNKNMNRKNKQRTSAMVLSIILVIAMVISLAAPFFR